ncbi:MAG: MBL fold metallo-hydrolase [Methanosarcinaceae archaeon]|nr:MBL fold metallo-hydrolase [Methanosarcinaceae archaeon]
MELTVLVDNNTLIDRYFYGEPGLSFLINDGGKKILFDTGYSDAFLKNASRMGIKLLDIDHLVLSHGHLDHTWGLDPLIRTYTEARIEGILHSKPILTAHPQAFCTKHMEGIGEIGTMLSVEKISEHFQIQLSREPVWLTQDLVFLGEIPRKFDFEGKESIGTTMSEHRVIVDHLIDDTALAYRTQRGLVIITGCSHSGICNITEYAREVCREDRVIDIIGGLHLLDPSREQLDGTLEYMGRLVPEELHACHCTDLRSKIELAKVVNLREVGVGLNLKY